MQDILSHKIMGNKRKKYQNKQTRNVFSLCMDPVCCNCPWICGEDSTQEKKRFDLSNSDEWWCSEARGTSEVDRLQTLLNILCQNCVHTQAHTHYQLNFSSELYFAHEFELTDCTSGNLHHSIYPIYPQTSAQTRIKRPIARYRVKDNRFDVDFSTVKFKCYSKSFILQTFMISKPWSKSMYKMLEMDSLIDKVHGCVRW